MPFGPCEQGRAAGFPALEPQWRGANRFFPPLRINGSALYPTRHLYSRGDDSDRHDHFLKRGTTVIAVLAHPVSGSLTPWDDHASTVRAHPGSRQHNLVRAHLLIVTAPTIAEIIPMEPCLVIEQMPVVTGEHHDPTGHSRLVQQGRNNGQVLKRPSGPNLIGLSKVVVDGVHNCRNDSTVRRGNP